MASLAEHLPRALVERGIDTAFAVPGRSTVSFYPGLVGSALRHISARSEVAAGFMADGYARATGRPAAVFAASGPGMNSLSVSLRTALNASTPLLALCVVDSDGRAGLCDPEARSGANDAPSAFAASTHKVAAPGDLFIALDEAMDTFATRRPGPICIDIPRSIMEGEAGGGVPAPRRVAEPAPASAAELAEIVMRLDAAQRPLVVLGGGALAMTPQQATALAERLKAPVILTSNARGMIAPQHPLLVRAPIASAPVQALIAAADAALAIGVGFSTREWGARFEHACFAPDALIRIDIDADRLSQPPAPASALCGPAAPTVAQLMLSLAPHDRAPADLAPAAQAAVATMPCRIARHRPLVEAIWEHLPSALLVGDVTEPAHFGLAALVAPGPRRWWCSASGYGAPGYALPAAIGAKIGEHRRPVVALAGDRGVLYTIAELSSAIDARAPVILIVWNNSGDAQMREALLAARLKPDDFETIAVDFQALARGYGAFYQRVSGPAFFRDALREAMSRQLPTLLELREEFWFAE